MERSIAPIRPSRPLIYMSHAELEATRSTCFRGNVGAVLVSRSTRGIVASGYNGPPPGEDHCRGHTCEGAFSGCHRSVHAEMNAVNRISGEAQDIRHLDLYVTLSPCEKCMEMIDGNVLIDRLFFRHEYRDTEHLERYAMPIYKVTPAGYITLFKNQVLIDPETLYD